MIPDGELLRSRVEIDPADPLADVLDRELDGYALLEPRSALLGDGDDHGVVTFDSGVPTLVYHTGTERGGPPALSDIGTGPHHVEVYAVDPAELEAVHENDDLRVPPGMPAERLAGDTDLAERTRQAATPSSDDDSVVAFLKNESAIDAIRSDARAEAARRAEEWGFDDAIDQG
ncbi:MAG: hypothetical protein PPP58_10415 [Natronomonas sp.]